MQAEQTCGSMTSLFPDGKVTVASVLNEYENEFILAFFGSDLTNRSPPLNIWLGMTSSSMREVTWSDGHHLDYTNWGHDEPSNDQSKVNWVKILFKLTPKFLYFYTKFILHFYT